MQKQTELKNVLHALEDLKSYMMLELAKMNEDDVAYQNTTIYPIPEIEEISLPVSTVNGEQVFFILRIFFEGALPPYINPRTATGHDPYYKDVRTYYEIATDAALRTNRERPSITKAVVFLRHHFKDLIIRDLDNRNRKLIIDALRKNQVMGEDAWQHCSFYEEGVLAEKNAVEVFVMEQHVLPYFLLHERKKTG